jgi:hypothetical protein
MAGSLSGVWRGACRGCGCWIVLIRTVWREWRVVVAAVRKGGSFGRRAGVQREHIEGGGGLPARRAARVGEVDRVLLVVLRAEGAHEARGGVVLLQILGWQ